MGSGVRKLSKFGKDYFGAKPQFFEKDIFKIVVSLTEMDAMQATEQATEQATMQDTMQAAMQDERTRQILIFCHVPQSREEIQTHIDIKNRDYFRKEILIPLLEKGFKDLMKYDSKSDQIEPTLDLLNGESDILKAVAANVKDWAGSWDAVWDNIMLRTQIKEAIVNAAEKTGQDELLEAQFVVQANDEFHKIAEEIKDELGAFDNKKIFFEWNEWLKKAIKRKEVEVV